MSKKQYYRNVTRTLGCTKVRWVYDGEEHTTYIAGKYFFNEVLNHSYFKDKKIIETSTVKCQFSMDINKFIELADCKEVED